MPATDSPLLQEVWTPRDDVLQGEIRDESLAADVHEVAYGENVPAVYDDAETFFDLTYPTAGVTGVIEAVAQRVIAHNHGEHPEENGTIILDTSFGGGKTHSQIAAYHLAEHSTEIPDLRRYTEHEATAEGYRAIEDDSSVRTAVFVGTKYAPKPVKPSQVRPSEHTPEIQTIWGHIAYQLYGVEGYQIVSSGNSLIAPGEQTLDNLFSLSEDPAVIIMDEIAAYLSHSTAVSVNDGNLAEQTLTFLMALFGYASNNSDVTVIMSVAADAFEDFAKIFDRDLRYDDAVMDTEISVPIAEETIQEFQNIHERVANTITPVEDSNVADVLRNRLFENNVSDDLREKVADRYDDFYTADSSSFPDDATQPETRERLKETYPFHPTVVDTLTKQIDAVPSFQKARGALKLLAPAVMRLWTDDDPLTTDRELIRLYDLHPQDERTRKMLRSIFSDIEMDFEPAVKDDIYSADPNDTPNAYREDDYWLSRGQPPLGTRVVTTTLWKSLVKGAGSTGTSREYIRYASATPDEVIDHYDSAIGNLLGDRDESACFYLHGENNNQLKFKTIVTVEKAINQATPRRGRVSNLVDEALYNAALGGSGSMTVYENPQAVHEVDDTIETLGQLVVVEPSTLTIGEPADIKETIITKLYEESASSRHGNNSPRTYKNNLIFLVPGVSITRARNKASRLASIRIVQDNPEDFGLQDAQLDELPTKRDETRGELENLVKNGYSHVFIPSEPAPDQPHEGLAHYNITVTDNTIIDAVVSKLADRGEVITNDEPAYRPEWLTNNLWRAIGDSMTTQELKEQIGKTRSAEILLDPRPLQRTIERAVTEPASGYAYWNDDRGRGYVDQEAFQSAFDDHDAQITFDDARNLISADKLDGVSISSSERIYESTDALLDAVTVTWQCSDCGERFGSTAAYVDHACTDPVSCETCGKTFETEGAYQQHLPCDEPTHRCSDCGQQFDTQTALSDHHPCPWPRTVTGKTTDPAVISEAVSTVTADIEAQADRIENEFDDSVYEISQSLTEMTLRLEGTDTWKRAEWIAGRLPSTEGFDNVAVELEYEARYDDSDVVIQFAGDAETFADRLKHTAQPGGSPDDQYIEILIESDTSLTMAELDTLEDIVPQATAVEMSVTATLKLTDADRPEVSP